MWGIVNLKRVPSIVRCGIRALCKQAESECPSGSETKGAIIGIYKNEDNELVLTQSAQKLNDQLQGKIYDMIKYSKADLSAGKGVLFNNVDSEYWAVAAVGLGRAGAGYNELEAVHEGMEAVRQAAGVGVRLLAKERVSQIMVDDMGYPEQAGEGAVLSLWRYQDHKNQEFWKVIPKVELLGEGAEEFQRGAFKSDAQNWARRLCDVPSNLMSPMHFAQEATDALCPCGVQVDVWDRDKIEAHKLNLFMHVAKGSCEPPLVLFLEYCGGPELQKPIMLIGKGITFDSGGVCLRDKDTLAMYRGDLTGAATILATMKTVAALRLPANIKCIIPVCESMTSGMSMKCGDIVPAHNGATVKIVNTSHEGGLLIADALALAQSTFSPRLLIDVASLCTEQSAPFGSGATTVFTNSQTMWSQTRKAAILTGDRVWRMPLWKYYAGKVTNFTSHDADNQGLGPARACLAAAFLNSFITCIDWIHFDVGGVGLRADDKTIPYLRKGRMTGRPTRTLIQLLYQLICPEEGARNYRTTI